MSSGSFRSAEGGPSRLATRSPLQPVASRPPGQPRRGEATTKEGPTRRAPHPPPRAAVDCRYCHPCCCCKPSDRKGQDERQEKRGDQEIILTGKIKKGSVSPGGKTCLSSASSACLGPREVSGGAVAGSGPTRSGLGGVFSHACAERTRASVALSSRPSRPSSRPPRCPKGGETQPTFLPPPSLFVGSLLGATRCYIGSCVHHY